uniref:U1-type domain-containing protein n=1 Tax=Musca domestica TaxID=7370 RepID=A0A1I8MKI3_MUSDO
MSARNGQEDRLTKLDFIHLIPHLPLNELLLTEFYNRNNWCKLFQRKNPNLAPINCKLCNVEASSFKNLLEHVDGRKHQSNIDNVVELYHPEYTQPKSVLVKQKNNNKGNGGGNASGIVAVAKRKIVLNPVAKAAAAKESLVVNPCAKAAAAAAAGSGGEKEKQMANTAAKVSAAGQKEKQLVNPAAGKVATAAEDKKVVNPAAKVAAETKSKVEPKTENKSPASATTVANELEKPQRPQYTTNKIIIPTKLKNKNGPSPTESTAKPIPVRSGNIAEEKNKKPPKKNQPQKPAQNAPTFSTKEFSLKPDSSDVPGLLGVEYVIKMLRSSKDTSPRYECGLCELVLDGFAMQRHLEGYNHRLKFCEKHFPTAIRHYRQYMHGLTVTEELKVMTKVLAKLARAIEKYHGRNLPYECYERDFSMNRHSILAKAFSCRHASEQYGPTFTHVIEATEINQFKNELQIAKAVPSIGQEGPIFDSQTGPYSAAITSSFPNVRQFGNGPMYNGPSPMLAPRGGPNPMIPNPNLNPNPINICDQYSSISTGGNMLYAGGNPASLMPQVPNNFLDLNSGNYSQYNPPMPDRGGDFMDTNHPNMGNYQEFPNPIPSDRRMFPPEDLPDPNSFESFNPVMAPGGGYRRQPVNDMSTFTGPSAPPLRSPTSNFNGSSMDLDLRDAGPNHNYESMVEDFLKTCKERDRQKRASYLTEEDRFIENVEMYHKIVDKRIGDLKRKFEKYRKDPETYPDYSEEWQKFWKRRKEELKALGLDHRSYNFQPEWVKFVKIRLEEIYNLEVESIKQKTRDALGLNLSNVTKPNTKVGAAANEWGGNPGKRRLSPATSFDDDEADCMPKKRQMSDFNLIAHYGGNPAGTSNYTPASRSSSGNPTATKQKSLSETLAELIKPKSKF